ncbi:MAG: Transcriptional regulator, LysR family [Polaromonas sp.]|nr:Transcriptional regulator, LysR family [Polaromonas sp.]
MPPLNALKAFEAAARHLSFTRAAAEMNVTTSALSHQVRGLEEFLGVRLFERNTRAIALTAYGQQLYPGLQAGFGLLRDAVGSLRTAGNEQVLVISTSPGLTSKWLASRLHRFADAHAKIEIRVSSSQANANFVTGGVDAAIRQVTVSSAQGALLSSEKLFDVVLAPVCSPKLLARFGLLEVGDALRQVPLIHDDSQAGRPEVPTWDDWLKAACRDAGDLRRGLRFSSADHALDAALEGAGLLLAHTIMAYDDLRSGRLVMPFDVFLPTQRAYHFVCPKKKENHPNVRAFRDWLHAEVSRLDLALLGLS